MVDLLFFAHRVKTCIKFPADHRRQGRKETSQRFDFPCASGVARRWNRGLNLQKMFSSAHFDKLIIFLFFIQEGKCSQEIC
jgi:hypothetical protein